MGVGPEVPNALPLRSPHDLQPWELLVEGDRQRWIGLVVPVPHVEARFELLDPGVFELERLDLGAVPPSTRRSPPWSPSAGYAGVVRSRRRSRNSAAAEGSSPSHVDDPPAGVPEAVHPGIDGNGAWCRAVRGRIRHRSSLGSSRSRRCWPRTGRSRRAAPPGPRRPGTTRARRPGPGRRLPTRRGRAARRRRSYSRFSVVENIGGSSELIVTGTPAATRAGSGCRPATGRSGCGRWTSGTPRAVCGARRR